MRRLDNGVGIPLCRALGALEWVARLGRTPPPFPAPAQVKRILVMKFLGLGTIVQAIPMLRTLRRRHPDARIVFLTFDSCAEFVKCLGYCDEVIAIRSSSLLAFAWDNLRAVIRGHLHRFDVSYDLEFFSKYSYIMSYLIHAKVRAGYFIPLLRHVRLLTHPVPYNSTRHMSEIMLAQLDPVTTQIPQAEWEAPNLPAEADSEIDELLRRYGVLEDPLLIALNVNAGELSTLRRWPPDYYADLVMKLSRRYAATFLFIGHSDDRSYVQDVIAKIGPEVRLLNLAGLTSLRGLLALFRRVKLVVSNDSGPLHLASLMGAPTVAFFGPESGSAYGPKGEKHVNLDKKLYCSPCLNVFNFKEFDCPYGVRCLTEIKPQEAFEAACGLLGAVEAVVPATPLARQDACPVCGSHTPGSALVERRVALLVCTVCRFSWQNPRPTSAWLEALYRGDYYKPWKLEERPDEVRRLKLATFSGWLERIEKKLGRRGRLLDLGCASGFMLEAAQERGWEVYGVELSHAAETAQKRFGSAVTQGRLEDARFPDGHFDAVTMFDFIEHLENAKQILAEVRRVLRDDGVLALSTPNVDSATCTLMGKRWPHYKEEHLVYFSTESLAQSLSQAGYSILEAGPAAKVLDLTYATGQFEQYPHPVVTPILRRLAALLPASWMLWPLRFTLGESFVVAEKKVT